MRAPTNTYLVLALALGCASVSAQNLVLNGGFENPVVTYGDRLPTTAFDSWTTGNLFGNTPYGVDVIPNGVFGTAHSGNQFLDLESDNCSYGNFLRQDISTVPGQTYQISYWYANSKDSTSATAHLFVKNGSTTLLDDSIFHQGSTVAIMNWTLGQDTFTADSATTSILFVHYSSVGPYPGNTSITLDNVSVIAVPEPGALSLLGLGLAAWVGTRARQRRQASPEPGRPRVCRPTSTENHVHIPSA